LIESTTQHSLFNLAIGTKFHFCRSAIFITSFVANNLRKPASLRFYDRTLNSVTFDKIKFREMSEYLGRHEISLPQSLDPFNQIKNMLQLLQISMILFEVFRLFNIQVTIDDRIT